MANLLQLLKSEIVKISRNEIKSAFSLLINSNSSLERTVSELKNRLAALENQKKSFSAPVEKTKIQPKPFTGNSTEVWFTAKTIKALRNKLGVSQENFGKLIGISGQAVLVMEKKKGKFNLRAKTLSGYLAVQKLNKEKAQQLVSELKNKAKAKPKTKIRVKAKSKIKAKAKIKTKKKKK